MTGPTPAPRPRRLTVQERADLLESGPELLRANGTAFLWRAVAWLAAVVWLGAWGFGWYATAAQFHALTDYGGQPRAAQWLSWRAALLKGDAAELRSLKLADSARYRAAGWPGKLAKALWACQTRPQCLNGAGGALRFVRTLPDVMMARKVSQAAGGALLLAVLPALVATSDAALWERRVKDAQRRARRQRAQGQGVT